MAGRPRLEQFMNALPYLFLTPIAGILLALAGQEVVRGQTPPSPIAEAYLMQAIEIIRREHISSAQADWPKLIEQAREDVRGAESTSDTYRAISKLLVKLGENHSFFLRPRRQEAERSRNSSPDPPMPSWKLRKDQIGVLRIPGFDSFAHPDSGSRFSGILADGVRRLDRTPLCGWIVDVRANTGGNMWPMLAGMDPLLGAGPFGYFVRPNGTANPWLRPLNFSSAPLLGSPPSYWIGQANAPIAILLDSQTSSSGEMVAIALIGRKHTRTFGEQSAGYTTANVSFSMPDGAVLAVTSSYVRDRTGRDYRGSIEPHTVVAARNAEEAAAQWLTSRCRPSRTVSQRGHEALSPRA